MITGFGWIGVGLLVIEIVGVLWGVPKLIESEIRKSIRNSFDPQDEDQASLKDHLDVQNILTYAGEGVAETLAEMVIEKAIQEGKLSEDQGLADKPGRERFRKQF